MSTPESYTFVSWNALHGKGRPGDQNSRLAGLLDAADPLEPDAVGLYEVQGTDADNPAEIIAKRLGMKGYSFAQHGVGRPDEGVVLVTREKSEHRAVNLDPKGKQRAALIGNVGNVLVAAAHPSHNVATGPALRRVQHETLLDVVQDVPGVLMEDANALPRQQSRRMLVAAGYTSVLGTLPRYPDTFPVNPWTCDVGAPRLCIPPIRLILALRKLSIDDMFVRGHTTITHAGTLESANPADNSDHRGVHATIAF